MARSATMPAPAMQDATLRALHLVLFALCVANVAWLAAMYAGGNFLFDSLGRPKPVDFVSFWAAGKLALQGQATAAYDWAIHKQFQNLSVGYDFQGRYNWHNPPTFLLVATGLATVPFLISLVAWLAVTFSIYLVTVRWIAGHPLGWLLAAGSPATLATIAAGQNGFLTASLIGATLGFLERRPVLSGVCLGLLTYKPQFGLLFPIVLAVAGQWRVFWTAAATGAALALLSTLAFGFDSWIAFFNWLPVTSQHFLSEGHAEIGKQQSLFAIVRVLGGPESLAWAAQAVLALIVAAAVCFLWRSKAAFELKAAGLAAGTMLATPYVYLYDGPVLAVAVAFLLRYWLVAGFRAYELAGLTVAAAFMMAFTFLRVPFAFASALIVFVLVFMRAWPAVAPQTPGRASA
jgi:arabinofuranan 3-O-arabinosyltransferase